MEHVKAGHTLTIPSGIKPQLETLLKTCWNMTATKRPTASEIVELLSNNPRLISPCIDVPLASVQVERTDSLELIPSVSWLIVCIKGRLSYHLCVECFSKLSFDAEVYTKSAAVADFVYTSESNESCEKHSTQRWYDEVTLVFFKTKCLLPPKALDRKCCLVYHKTFFVDVLRKKECAVDIEVLMEPASPK